MPWVENHLADANGDALPQTVKFQGKWVHFPPQGEQYLTPAAALAVVNVGTHLKIKGESPPAVEHMTFRVDLDELDEWQFQMCRPGTSNRETFTFRHGDIRTEPMLDFIQIMHKAAPQRWKVTVVPLSRKKAKSAKQWLAETESNHAVPGTIKARIEKLREIAVSEFAVRNASTMTIPKIVEAMTNFDGPQAEKVTRRLRLMNVISTP